MSCRKFIFEYASVLFTGVLRVLQEGVNLGDMKRRGFLILRGVVKHSIHPSSVEIMLNVYTYLVIKGEVGFG